MADRHEARKPPGKKQKKRRKSLPGWARAIIIASKIIAVPLLCAVALYVGLVIGYAELGGQSAADVPHLATWKHLYDLVFAN